MKEAIMAALGSAALGSAVLSLLIFVIATVCRHRIVVVRHSAPKGESAEHRFLIENSEDVPLEFPFEIELAITGDGEFDDTPSLLCGYREFIFNTDHSPLVDTLSAKKNTFSFFSPKMRPLDT